MTSILRAAACVAVLAAASLPSSLGTLHAQSATPGAATQAMSNGQVRQRADALLAQMTPEEKAGQLSQLFLFAKPDEAINAKVASGTVGSLLFVTDPHVINQLQHTAVEKAACTFH